LAEKKLPKEQSDDASTSSCVQGSDETATELRSGIIHQLLLKHEAERDVRNRSMLSRKYVDYSNNYFWIRINKIY